MLKPKPLTLQRSEMVCVVHGWFSYSNLAFLEALILRGKGVYVQNRNLFISAYCIAEEHFEKL